MFPKRHKYNARRTVVDGKHFPSQLEADVYCYLRLLEKTGAISNLKCQDTVTLLDDRKWKVDFKFETSEGKTEWAEAKGIECERFKSNKLLWTKFGPGPITIFKRSGKGFKEERVVPVPLVCRYCGKTV